MIDHNLDAAPLLNCPFCGSHDIDESYAVAESSGERHESPGCMNCGAMADTIELWNTRAATDTERKLAEKEKELFEVKLNSRNRFDDLMTACDQRNAWEDKAKALERKLAAAREALNQFAQCNLSEDNCASFDIANRRIQRIAKAALASIENSSPQTTEKPNHQ